MTGEWTRRRLFSGRLCVLWLFSAMLAVALGVYGRSFPYTFQFDDFRSIVYNPSLRIPSLGRLWQATGQTTDVGGNRPVAFFTFALNWYWGGANPWGYRFVNVVIHAVNGVLVFGLGAAALDRAKKRRSALRWAPAAAALLWLVQPVQTNAVVYVVQRMTSLATLFTLAAFLAYVRGRAGRPWWYVAGAALFALACGTKEIAYALPVLLLLWECAFHDPLRRWLGARPWAIAAGIVVLSSVFPLALLYYRSGYVAYPFTWAQRLLTEARVVGHYWSLIAYPSPSRLSIDYAFPLSRSLFDPPTTILAVLAHGGLLALGVWGLVGRAPLLGFSLLGFYASLCLESTVIPLDLVFEHRLYLPSVFLAVGGAGVLDTVWRSRRKGRTAVGVAAVVCLVALWGHWTVARLDAWRDPVSLWTDVLGKFPSNARAFAMVGKEYQLRGELGRARWYFMEAVKRDPKDLRSLANLARIDGLEGNFSRALWILTGLVNGGLKDHIIFRDLGWVQFRLGNLNAARIAYETALTYESRLPDANFMLAQIWFAQGDLARSRTFARRALELDPTFTLARNLLEVLGPG